MTAPEKAPLELARIAAFLEGLEETIISKLVDRAQFSANPIIYEPGKSGFDGEADLSLFALRLRRQEEMDSAFGRFCVPEERPFTAGLPGPSRRVSLPPNPLRVADFDVVNMTAEIRRAYLALVPLICAPGDDGQYGSSVEHDIYALQAVARRVHFGALYVAESKYLADPGAYRSLADRKDASGLLGLLTRPGVEEAILARIARKVDHLQAEINPDVRRRVRPAAIIDFYRNHVIPLTKEGQIRYFLNRAPDAPRPR